MSQTQPQMDEIYSQQRSQRHLCLGKSVVIQDLSISKAWKLVSLSLGIALALPLPDLAPPHCPLGLVFHLSLLHVSGIVFGSFALVAGSSMPLDQCASVDFQGPAEQDLSFGRFFLEHVVS